jgi:hypothetical protein
MARRVNHRGLVVLLIAVALVLGACAGTDEPKAVAGLDERTQQIGGLEVTVTPTKLDASGAAFTVVFDTHTGAPTIDIARSAELIVDGRRWTDAAWSGEGGDGHHRTGSLRFTATGDARGTARLAIDGLDQPVEMTWQLTPVKEAP